MSEISEKKAFQRAERALASVYAHPTLRRRGPKGSNWRFEISLVSSRKISGMNREYRGKSGPTDVLSFPAPEPFWSSGILGEVVVAKEVLARQAREQGHSVDRELDVLLVHGILHLLGMDHERDEKGLREMKRWEQKVLAHLWKEKNTRGLIERAD